MVDCSHEVLYLQFLNDNKRTSFKIKRPVVRYFLRSGRTDEQNCTEKGLKQQMVGGLPGRRNAGYPYPLIGEPTTDTHRHQTMGLVYSH